jgi:hypothetical protein
MLVQNDKIIKISVLDKYGVYEYYQNYNKTITKHIGNATFFPGPVYSFNSPYTNDITYLNKLTGVYEFFPHCYRDDNVLNSFKLSFALDYGVFLKLGSTKAVIDELENQVALMRLVYMQQLNIRLDILNVFIGKSTSQVPLNRYGDTCKQVLGVQSEFYQWVNNYNQPSSLWMLLSYCFQGITGISYIGSICSSNSNNIANFDWLTMAHELGHAFGAYHTFQNGVGTTGGIMDYGDGKYNGVYQFHPANKVEICPFVDYLKNTPGYETCVQVVSSTCGDGILSKHEECECTASTYNVPVVKCGKRNKPMCIGCKLTKPVECSAADFIIGYNDSLEFVSINNAGAISGTECCVKNKLKGPKTLCNHGMNVCANHGACIEFCTKYFGQGTPNCGFDASGCNLGCFTEGICINQKLYTNLPDGTSCFLNGIVGKCVSGKCK